MLTLQRRHGEIFALSKQQGPMRSPPRARASSLPLLRAHTLSDTMFEADEATEREAKVADWACVSWSLWHSSVVWGLKGAERDAVADE